MIFSLLSLAPSGRESAANPVSNRIACCGAQVPNSLLETAVIFLGGSICEGRSGCLSVDQTDGAILPAYLRAASGKVLDHRESLKGFSNSPERSCPRVVIQVWKTGVSGQIALESIRSRTFGLSLQRSSLPSFETSNSLDVSLPIAKIKKPSLESVQSVNPTKSFEIVDQTVCGATRNALLTVGGGHHKTIVQNLVQG